MARYHYRRNPERLDAEDIIEVAEAMGLRNLAGLLRYSTPAKIKMIVDAINETLEDEDVGPLTDKQAWKRLAEIAGEVGKSKGWPSELVRALQDVFMEKSAAA